MRLRHKLISFDAAEMLEEANITSLDELRDKIFVGQAVGADDLRLAGLGMAKPLINLRIGQGRVEEILGEITVGSNPLGIEFKRVEGGSFVYQGEPAEIESFEMAETPFTIGQMKKLLETKEDEVRAIFQDSKWNIDKVIQESEKKIAEDVSAEERDNCPLVFVSQIEALALAELLGYKLPDERQWERAASGTTGLKRPWGENLSVDKAVYKDTGTRPVRSKPGGKSAEEIYDLIGLVWEWTSSWYDSDEDIRVLRGGSWCDGVADDLSAVCRSGYHPGGRGDDVAVRFARPIK
ncbi:MAG: SUMF1/EgtB/PvdO family nonheme iron enzyme [Candidatus Saganbacteria bacterium]|nr:SUMF1/EgtB/PvdO family nonheme iron enzyme [Candidatus Saganbacteria bacterium]